MKIRSIWDLVKYVLNVMKLSGEIEMKRKDIVREIKKYEKQVKTGGINASNMAMNILSVLEFMLNKWDNTDDYDEETDFKGAYDNAVDEITEAEKDRHKLFNSRKEFEIEKVMLT